MKNLRLRFFFGLLACITSLQISAQTALPLPLNITSNDQISIANSGNASSGIDGKNLLSFWKTRGNNDTGDATIVIPFSDVPGRLKLSITGASATCTDHKNYVKVFASADNSSYRQIGGTFNHKTGTVSLNEPLEKNDRYIKFYYEVALGKWIWSGSFCGHGWKVTVDITEPISLPSPAIPETITGGITYTGKFTVNYSNPAGDLALSSSDPDIVLQITRIEGVAGQEGSREITYTYTPSATGTKHTDITVTDEGNSDYSKVLGMDVTTHLPAAPSLDGIDNAVAFTSFKAAWQPVTNATAYLLKVTDAEGNIIEGYDDFVVTDATSVDITGLLPGTSLKYSVKTRIGDFVSEASAAKEITTLKPVIALTSDLFTTVAGTPVLKTLAVSATNLSGDIAVTIAGDNASLFTLGEGKGTIAKDAEPKQIDVTYSPAEPGAHTATLTLTSEYAEPVTVTLNGTANPAVPANPVATAVTPVGFTAGWDAVSGATGYLLTVTTSEGGAVEGYTAKDTGIETSCEVSGLTASTAYIFKVVAKSGDLSSSETVSETVTTLATPVITPLEAEAYATTAGKAASKILTIDAADLYGDITITVSGDNAALFTLGEGEGTIAKDAEPKQINVTYTPTEPGVHTATLTLTSQYAESVTATLNGTATLAAPANLAATAVTPVGFTAGWDAVTGAVGYLLTVTTSEGGAVEGYTAKEINNGTSCPVTGLASATAYIFKVTAKNGDIVSSGTTSDPVSTLVAPVINVPVVSAFETLVSDPVEQKITVTASDLLGNIAVAITGDDAAKFIADVTTLEKTGRKEITVTYTSDEAGAHTATLTLTSEYAAAVNVTLNGSSSLAKPDVVVGDEFESEITVSWDAVAGAAEYHVTLYKGETPVEGYDNEVTDKTSFTFANLTGSTRYYVVVTAVSGANSTASEKVAVTTTPTGVKNVSADVVTVYPNPAVSELYIKGVTVKEVRIYSANGKYLISARPSDNKVDVSSLASGIYSILIKSDEGVARLQFIKK